jgi:hypothetical protein
MSVRVAAGNLVVARRAAATVQKFGTGVDALTRGLRFADDRLELLWLQWATRPRAWTLGAVALFVSLHLT